MNSEKKIKKIAVKIAELSALPLHSDKLIWWGYDTDIGNLPADIELYLKDVQKITRKATAEEVVDWLEKENIVWLSSKDYEKLKKKYLGCE
jgi:hypothetical protein